MFRKIKFPILLILIAIFMSSMSFASGSKLGSVRGYKFNDLNGNGVDNSEPRLANFRIILSSVANPSFQQEDVTDNQGRFSFNNLPLGEYEVCEIAPVVTPPWIPTTPSCVTVNLRGKVPKAFVRFGNMQEEDDNGGPVGCVRTQGYWGSSPAGQALLITLVNANGGTLALGNNSYTAAELDEILDTPAGGNALLILSHQLIAAKLNVLNGADDSQISDEIAEADALIADLDVGEDSVAPASPLGQQMIAVAGELDDFNNGRMNVPSCQ